MNQVLNSFQLNGGSIQKSGKVSQNGTRKDIKPSTNSLNKSGQVGGTRNTNNILSSVGL